MSDYNVTVKNVDSAMDMLESYSKEANDVRAHILFDMSSLFAAVEQKIDECQRSIKYESSNDFEDDSQDRSITKVALLTEQLNQLEAIKSCCAEYGQELSDEIKQLFMCAEALSTEGLQEMGRYISKLNLITGSASAQEKSFSRSDSTTFVCVIDSSRYPQTAEHIRTAQNMGFPSVLTIDRDNAAERRRASLENVATSQFYDRDEYPCAVFSEGGHGADVVYIQGSDNRGAGSYMRWQMQNMPNGSQIRIRVV